MSKINKMTLKQILGDMQLVLSEYDIDYFCIDEEVAKKLVMLHNSRDKKSFIRYLYEQEDKLDKEKLILCLYLNFQENLNVIRHRIQQLHRDPKNFQEYNELLIREGLNNKYIQRMVELGKHTDVYKYSRKYKKDEFEIEIISSKEIFKKQKLPEKRKIEKWQEIDNEIGYDGIGSTYILRSLVLTDLGNIFPSYETGMVIRMAILNKCASQRGYATIEELDYLRENQCKEYESIVNNIPVEEYLLLFREEIIKNIRFIDIDKLLLIAAYRIEYCLETRAFKREDIPGIGLLMNYIKEKIEDKRKSFREILEELDTYKEIEVEYSYKDLEACIKRFIGDTYIKKSEILQLREDVISGNTLLEEIEGPIFNFLNLNKDEIEHIMQYDLVNFIYGVQKLSLTEIEIIEKLSSLSNMISADLINYLYGEKYIGISAIIKLYNSQLINAEFFKEFSEENDISSEISLQKIQEEYLRIKENKEPNEDDIIELDTIIEFYRIVNLEDKTQDEIEEESNNVMYELAENFEEEEDILFYYEKGLLTLLTVAEWSGEPTIEKLYDESKITFEDLESLYKKGKISQQLLQSKITMDELDYLELLAHINSGYFNPNKVIELYMKGRIFDYDFEQIAINGIISAQQYYEATSKRTKEELEKNAQIKLKPVLTNIPDKKIRVNIIEEGGTDGPQVPTNKNKTLIDPNIRYEFLELLGAKEAEAVIFDENNPFYNYEFFVIPDLQGNLEANSVVIAERFYEDKETEERFATENATYFFQYKDLIVNSNLTKKEMTKDKENIVFTANHRAGSWAISVLYKIAQTVAGQNFKEYKKGDERATRVIDELLKIYSHDQLSKILDLAGRIDDTGEYIYEEVTPTCAKKSNKSFDDESR